MARRVSKAEYLSTCVRMRDSNQQQVDNTQRKLKRANSPSKKADLQYELEGWERWTHIWSERVIEAENDLKNGAN